VPDDAIVSILDLLALPIPSFVDAAYRHLLGRNADPVEMQQRCGALRAGLGRFAFLSDMATSAEFQNRRDGAIPGLSDAAFLEDVYHRYLGRLVDPNGMDRYLRLLARGRDRRRVVQQIADSREARTKRTFWVELEELVADERASRHWFWRWPGRYRRRERRRNRIVELTLYRDTAQEAQTGPAGPAIARLD
jgi:hypothetical protein